MPTSSPDRSFRIAVLVAGVCLWAATALLATELIEYSRNTLDRNGRWVSSKSVMQVSVMGAKYFLATRIALHGNQLSLGEWHGYNEVHFARPVQPSEIASRFRLDPGAYLDVILDRRESGHQGIRLSRDDRFPSAWYRADRIGRIVERAPMTVPPGRLADGWHELRIGCAPDGIVPSIDGERLALVPIRIDGERFIGFGGGKAPAVIDRVRIVGRSGEILLDETFRNTRNYGVIAAVVGALSLIVVLLGAAPVLRGSGLAMRVAAYRGLTLLAVVLVLLSTVFGFDYLYWSSRYVYGGFLPNDAKPIHLAIYFESLRSELFGMGSGVIESISRAEDVRMPAALRRSLSAWEGPRSTPARMLARFRGLSPLVPVYLDDEELRGTPAKASGALRIGFLGTSQTYGVGAETISDTFVARVHARLASALENVPLETYNLSIPGSQSSELLRHYRESWRFVRPDLLIVNLSNNDSDPKVLVANLHVIAEETHRSGGAIVFVLEANSIERDLSWLLRVHSGVRKLGAELGVPVWDLHGYLASDGVYDSGRLWWDTVHISSYGQSLTADWLAARMDPLLRDRLARLQPAQHP